jgi:hypothetical protein
MMANDTITNIQESSYDSILENAQRTVFLKELFSQVNLFDSFRCDIFIFSCVVKRRILRI